VFNSLSTEVLLEIVDQQIVQLVHMLHAEKWIQLTVTKNAKQKIANLGTDTVFGARPLKRAIQEYVLDELAMMIIDWRAQQWTDIVLDIQNDTLLFSVQ
jgi:ATP-dependent Clp protease ATP-binding subunit ClpA